MQNPEHYTYRVQWSEEDGEYVGLCAEFAGLSHLDDTMEGALQGITALVKDIVNDMEKSGEEPPAPINKRRYSGRFQVRTSPALHRELAVQAAERNMSLNRYINDVLARGG